MEPWISFAIERAREEADECGKNITFSFGAQDVERVYTLKCHPDESGDGLWFQLKGGKIFNCLGERETVRKSCFERPIEGEQARTLAAVAIQQLDGFKSQFSQDVKDAP